MPRFNVYGMVTAGKHLGVFEAATKEEAIEKALESDKSSVNLCHQCAHQMDDPEIHSATAEEE